MHKQNNVKVVKLKKDNILIHKNINVKNVQISKYIMQFYKNVKAVKLISDNFTIPQLTNVKVAQLIIIIWLRTKNAKHVKEKHILIKIQEFVSIVLKKLS